MAEHKKNGMWKFGQFSWLNGSRADKATAEIARTRKFNETADAIEARVRAEGPWATALRLTTPFTTPGYRSHA